MRQVLLQGLLRRRRAGQRDDDHQGRTSPAGTGRTRTTPRSRWRSTAPRRTIPSPTTSTSSTSSNSVFLSGNATRDDAPNHIRIQNKVPREVAQTWVSMCPAQVYEIPEDQLETGAETVDVHVTASNCVQCGAITAKGGRLTLPEGGDGPLYHGDLRRRRPGREAEEAGVTKLRSSSGTSLGSAFGRSSPMTRKRCWRGSSGSARSRATSASSPMETLTLPAGLPDGGRPPRPRGADRLRPLDPDAVGVGRYVREGDGDRAEAAVTVADDWQGKGLGTALTRVLGGRGEWRRGSAASLRCCWLRTRRWWAC